MRSPRPSEHGASRSLGVYCSGDEGPFHMEIDGIVVRTHVPQKTADFGIVVRNRRNWPIFGSAG